MPLLFSRSIAHIFIVPAYPICMKDIWEKNKIYIIFVVLTLAVGGVAALLTGNTSEYYDTLNQPPFSPPAWIFPIAWGILYILMGIGAGIIYKSDAKEKRQALKLYIMQLLVNFFWPIIFFNVQSNLISFVWILILFALVIAMTIEFYSISKKAALLQLPYILWLIYASYLNLGILILNG